MQVGAVRAAAAVVAVAAPPTAAPDSPSCWPSEGEPPAMCPPMFARTRGRSPCRAVAREATQSSGTASRKLLRSPP